MAGEKPLEPSTYADLSAADKALVDSEILRGLMWDARVGLTDPGRATSDQMIATSALMFMSMGADQTSQPMITAEIERRIEDAREAMAAAPFTIGELRNKGPLGREELADLGITASVNPTRFNDRLIAMDGDQYTPQTHLPLGSGAAPERRNR